MIIDYDIDNLILLYVIMTPVKYSKIPIMQNPSEKETLLEFPCEFSVKAMGYASDTLDAEIIAIVKQHVPDLSENPATSKASRNGKYRSITVTFMAHSKAQLDAIYQDLTDSDKVVMAL